MARNNNDTVYPFYSEFTISEGNVATDPKDISNSQDGSVVVFRIAANYRKFDGTEGTRFRNVKVTNSAAVHCWNSVNKRGRVIVVGRVEGNDYETNSGEQRSEDTILADYVGLSLRFHDAEQEINSGRRRNDDDGEQETRRRSTRRRRDDDDEEDEDEAPTPRRRSTRRSSSDDEEEPTPRRRRSSKVETRGDDEDEDFQD